MSSAIWAIVGLASASPPLGWDEAGPSIGTDGPLLVRAVDTDGRWVYFCQASEDTDRDGALRVTLGYHGETSGDEMRGHLAIGGGPELPIDDLVGRDATGTQLVIAREGRLEILDIRAPTDRLPLVDAWAGEAASFFDDGRLLYLTDGSGQARAIVRSTDGQERTIDHGTDVLWSAEAWHEWMVLGVVSESPTSSPPVPDACSVPPLTRMEGRSFEGPLRRSLQAVDGGFSIPIDPWALPFRLDDGRVLVATATGSWNAVAPDGSAEERIPAACGAQILGVHPSGIVVACDAEVDRQRTVPLAIYGTEVRRLETRIPRVRPDRQEAGVVWGDLLVLHLNRQHVIQATVTVDLVRDRGVPIGISTALVGLRGRTALVAPGDYQAGLRLLDLDTLGQTRVAGYAIGTAFPGTFQRYFASDTLVDLEAAQAVGVLPSAAIAVTPDGRVLVPSQRAGNVPVGPLLWLATQTPAPRWAPLPLQQIPTE